MAKVTYQLSESDAHSLAAALQTDGYGVVMPPDLVSGEERRVVVTVEDGEEDALAERVREMVPDAKLVD
jgi:hypothetical protein